jgi:Flp pilus assembly protein TadB
VRLVDREERDARAVDQAQEPVLDGALGRDVEHRELAAEQGRDHVAAFILFGGLSSFLSTEVNWLRTIVIGTISAVVAFLGPRFYLRTLKKQRLAKFNEQL